VKDILDYRYRGKEVSEIHRKNVKQVVCDKFDDLEDELVDPEHQSF